MSDVLEHIRERIVTTLLRFCALLGTPAVIIGTVALAASGAWIELLIGNVALLIIIFLAFQRQIPYQIRSAVLVTLAYLYLLSASLHSIDEFQFATLFAFVVMTTLLLGRTGGFTATLLSFVTIWGTHWGLASGRLLFQLDLVPFSAPLPQLIAPYTSWLFYVGIFLFTMWIYFDGFYVAWQREREATALLQAERDRLAQALQREHQLMIELESSYQRENELNRLQSEIITTVSHEFRTPLTTINTSADLLLRYGEKLRPRKKERIHQRIRQSIDYLTTLLDDVSLVHEANSKGIVIYWQEIAFNQLGHSLKNDLLHEHTQPANLHFIFDPERTDLIRVDYAHLKEVVENLVSNSLNYSEDNDRVDISIALYEWLEITVTDRGIGIPQHDIEHIWDLFYRGGNVETRRGLGLGLYIVKRIVTAMAGTITAESAGPGYGSRFTVTIPQLPPRPALSASPQMEKLH